MNRGYGFRILGPMAIHRDGRPLTVGGPKQRMLLLCLLFNANRAVALDWLAAALWDVDPPASATSNIRGYAMSLRRRLAGLEGVRIVSRGRGYELIVPPLSIDLTVFDGLTAEGRDAFARGEFALAARRFEQAVGLWRGPIADDLSCGKPLAARLAMLQERRLAVGENLAETRLALGRAAEAVGDLRVLVGDHPLHEHTWALLIRALYGSGDTAGALRAHAEVRGLLVERLGLEPGSELQQVHRAVLRRDPRLAGGAAGLPCLGLSCRPGQPCRPVDGHGDHSTR